MKKPSDKGAPMQSLPEHLLSSAQRSVIEGFEDAHPQLELVHRGGTVGFGLDEEVGCDVVLWYLDGGVEWKLSVSRDGRTWTTTTSRRPAVVRR